MQDSTGPGSLSPVAVAHPDCMISNRAMSSGHGAPPPPSQLEMLLAPHSEVQPLTILQAKRCISANGHHSQCACHRQDALHIFP